MRVDYCAALCWFVSLLFLGCASTVGLPSCVLLNRRVLLNFGNVLFITAASNPSGIHMSKHVSQKLGDNLLDPVVAVDQNGNHALRHMSLMAKHYVSLAAKGQTWARLPKFGNSCRMWNCCIVLWVRVAFCFRALQPCYRHMRIVYMRKTVICPKVVQVHKYNFSSYARKLSW